MGRPWLSSAEKQRPGGAARRQDRKGHRQTESIGEPAEVNTFESKLTGKAKVPKNIPSLT